jgi:ribonuclease HI
LIAGLGDLLDRLHREQVDPHTVRLEVCGDSRLVLSQLDGSWKTKEPRLQRLRDQALDLLAPFARVVFRHQPRAKSVALLGH